MASNTIVTRVYDFLKLYPPFSYLPQDKLFHIATKVQVMYFGQNDEIFKEDAETGDYVYILQKGRVDITKIYEDQNTLIDICDDGDIFGVRSVLNNKPYLGSAIAREDSLLYAIPKGVFLELLQEEAQISLFFAAGFASGTPVVRGEQGESHTARKELLFFSNENPTRFMSQEDVLIVNPIEEVITCEKETTIKEAARQMTSHRIGSILVQNKEKHPIGIVTDTDFTRKVIHKGVAPDASIATIMSSPVFTIAPNATVSEYIVKMIKNKVKHLVVTEDGTDQSPIYGIASEHDILLMHGNDPAILVKRLLKARSIDTLAKIRDRAEQLIINYLKQEVAIEFITEIMTEINGALIQRAVEMAIEKLEKEGMTQPDLKFCWLALGSEGRGEQLNRTDQDNAIVYENPPKGTEEEASKYFLALGTEVVETLVKCGFSRCKGEIMASNPKWNLSMRDWKMQFRQWINIPEPMALMHSSIFFDLRGDYGDIELAEELYQFILETIEKRRGVFLAFMAQNALQNPPPLSFFKNFMVERSGDNKDRFDIKKRSMMPLTDAARLLTLAEGFSNINNTFKRFEKLKELIPNRAQLFDEAAMAYEMFIRQRALNGFKYNNAGRFINPKDLNKIERQTLKTAFKTIEEVQLYIKNRFNLGFK